MTQRIKNNQKFLLKLLNLHIGGYYPLRKWIGIDYKGKIDEVSHLSIAYNHYKGGKKLTTRIYQQPDFEYKLNLVLDKIPQLALLPALLQPAYGLGALAFFFLTQTTYQPSSKDNNMASNAATTNYGNQIWLTIHDYGGGSQVSRDILEFDISDIPASAVFSQGDLSLYYYSYGGADPSEKTVWAYKLTRTDWVELESTWNIYKTGSNWTSAGGDYVTSNPSGGSVNAPADYGWMTFDIQAIVEDAYDNSNDVEVLTKFALEDKTSGTRSSLLWYSNNYTDDTSKRPKLTVTYTTTTTPTVTTQAVDEITTTTGDGNGNITDTGGADVTERGFVYDTTSRTDPGNTSPAASDYPNVKNETGTYSTGTLV